MLTVNMLELYGLGSMLDIPPCNILDIPQQNPLKYGFSGIEASIITRSYHMYIRIYSLHELRI